MFAIKANNPKGLNFDHVADRESAPQILRNIVAMGGTNITINGNTVTEDMLAKLTA